MLTYTPARALLRGAHAAGRCSSRPRMPVSSSASSNFYPSGAAFFYSSPGALATTRTRVRTPQDESTCDTRGSLFASSRGFKATPTAENSLRCISSSATRLLPGGKDGREPAPAEPQQQQQQQQQQKPKGIRKVLPSLTPHENIYTVPNLLTFSRL
ncbi:hypothetical protein CHU98_g6378, partial [Xylaria longipes]